MKNKREKINRTMTCMLIIAMLTSVLWVNQPVYAAENGVETIINELKKLYPTGSYFSVNGGRCSHNADSTCSNCQLSNIKKQNKIQHLASANAKLADAWTCCAFARFLFYNIFGIDTYYYKTQCNQVSLSDIKVGDYVILNGHYGIFAYAQNGRYYLYESNIGGTNRVSYGGSGYTASSIKSVWRAKNYDSVANVDYFDFWCTDPTVIGRDTVKLWFKQEGYGRCDVNLDINGTCIGTIYQDENGFFSYELDTKKYNDGIYTIGAIIRSTSGKEKKVYRQLEVVNNSIKSTLEDGKLYYIVNVNSNKVLDVELGRTDNLSKVVQYYLNGANNQIWRAKKIDGYWMFISLHSGKVLDLGGGGTREGDTFNIYDKNDSPAQLFNVQNRGDCKFSLIVKCSGLALDIPNGSGDNNIQPAQYVYHGGSNQLFYFIEVSR